MSTSSSALGYEAILKQIQLLTQEEQLTLLADIAELLRARTTPQAAQHSILELQGLGKEIWNAIDGQEYVNRERDAWNG